MSDEEYGGYWDLALAVIIQAMRDLQRGTKQEKEGVRLCILDGGLDHWIHMVAPDQQTVDRIHGTLLEVMGGYDYCEKLIRKYGNADAELYESIGRH